MSFESNMFRKTIQPCTTGIVCAKCGELSKVSNYDKPQVLTTQLYGNCYITDFHCQNKECNSTYPILTVGQDELK